MTTARVLAPAVAGTWYPARRSELEALVDRLLDDAGEAVEARGIRAVVVPHAGFAYSGAVAAAAFRGLAGSAPDRILLLGPSHYFSFRGAAVPGAAVAQETPLGAVPFDGAALETLREASGFRADDRLFVPEHALEAEIPFLQRTLGGEAPIVPILVGNATTHADAVQIAGRLAPLTTPRTLTVVSSDFTHYGPRFGYVPFEDDVPRRVRELDLGAVNAITSGNGASFVRYVDTTGATICGRHAIDVALALPGMRDGSLLASDASGRMTGAWDNSVSYASIAFPEIVSRP